jgi:hypothetical protein
MAKLYWRVKRDGKWTWVAAHVTYDDSADTYVEVQRYVLKEEEE